MNAVVGGWANKELGNSFGTGKRVKKSYINNSSIVALRDGSLINIFEINLFVDDERVTESGKL